MWNSSTLIVLFCLFYLVSRCTADDFEAVDSENAIYKNSRGQCYINTCANCRGGGCCAEIVACPGTTTVSPDEDQKIYKNSRGQCYYKTCKNCLDGGCCVNLVPCYE